MYKRLTKKNKTTNKNHVFVFHTNNNTSPTTTSSMGNNNKSSPNNNNVILRPPRVYEHPNSIKRKKKKNQNNNTLSTSQTYDKLTAKHDAEQRGAWREHISKISLGTGQTNAASSGAGSAEL